MIANENLVGWIKKQLMGFDVGHDWEHAKRVLRNALKIAEKEGGDKEIIELAAITHDVIDHKFVDSDEATQILISRLIEHNIDKYKVDQVIRIITNISFSKADKNKAPDTLEFKIVQDADRLDAIGAIGIARTFSYGRFHNRLIYSAEDKEHTIAHFYEKLLKLKDLMNTKAGMELAQQRHDFMMKFLEQFYLEVE